MISKAVIILFIAGAGIPVMAALNSGLGMRLGNPIPAAFVLFMLATVITALLVFTNPSPTQSEISAIPAHFYLGGLFVTFYVLAMTWLAPKLGLGNAIFIVLFGQLVAAAAIDQFGLLDMPKAPITLKRLVGIGFFVLGIYLARKPMA